MTSSDEPVHAGLLAQNRAQLGDALLEIGELIVDPLALQSGQTLEAEVEDGLCLDLRQLELAL